MEKSPEVLPDTPSRGGPVNDTCVPDSPFMPRMDVDGSGTPGQSGGSFSSSNAKGYVLRPSVFWRGPLESP